MNPDCNVETGPKQVLFYLSRDNSVGSMLAWYQGGPGFKSRQGQEFFNEYK